MVRQKSCSNGQADHFGTLCIKELNALLKTTTETHSFTFLVMNPKFIGNKVKKQISKRVFQENNARQIFRKTNISYQATDINFFKVYLNKILKPT